MHLNSLQHETSPYLLSHARNPVNWYAWNNEAWKLATDNNKLVIISIGYSACHWCHVMERESFSNTEVAELMNKNFVSVKVDREERPDVDHVYMGVAQLLNKSGGWPLNVITLSNGQPIFVGTYFQKDQWISILSQILQIYQEKRKELESMATGIVDAINTQTPIDNDAEKQRLPNRLDLAMLVDNWKPFFDLEHGGTQRAPKFPLPCMFEFLLDYNKLHFDNEITEIISLTLEQMARGGIYDHVGGGFARYSTDAYWKVPHFEKMLYDNAQLLSLYAKAYGQKPTQHYKLLVEETIEFVKNELTSSEFAFYSSIDADSEGEEGKYYVWENYDIQKLEPEERQLAIEYFNILPKGNWEDGKNVLFVSLSDEEFAKKKNLDISTWQQQLLSIKSSMRQIRQLRPKPRLDNKLLTDWNALMLQGFIDTYIAFGNEAYLSVALKNAEFICTRLMDSDGKLYHNYSIQNRSIDGFIDDYAFSIRAFLSLFQVTCNIRWLLEARKLAEYTLAHFYSIDNHSFFFTSKLSEKLIKRNTELFDNVTPSANSVMAINLYFLGEWLEMDRFIDISEKMLQTISPTLGQTGPYAATWLRLAMLFNYPPCTISVVGTDCVEKANEIRKLFIPNTYVIGGINEELPYFKNKLSPGKTLFYVCKNRSCELPVASVSDVIAKMEVQI